MSRVSMTWMRSRVWNIDPWEVLAWWSANYLLVAAHSELIMVIFINRSFDDAEAIRAIREAIKMGINFIDTAPWYGQGKSETLIGQAVKGIPRQAYYLATKVGRYEPDFKHMFNFSAEATRKSLKKSLELLGVDYVDVIQVHDIEFAPSLDIILSQTLPELSKQVVNGKAKHIGVTGYPVSKLKEFIEKSDINVQTILSYARLTLIDDTLPNYIPFFKKQGIGIINAAVTAMGLLTNSGPPLWHPADANIKELCLQVTTYCKERDVQLGKLAVWYSMQFDDVATNLIGMQSIEMLNTNLDVMLNGITQSEKQVLSEIEEKYFSKLGKNHWEGMELEVYWKALNALAMAVECEPWGSVNGQVVEKFTMKNAHGLEVDVLSYGATIQAIRTPDKHGNIADVVLGFDNIEGYLGTDNPYFGATVGRVANRVSGASFILDGVPYTLAKNIPGHSLHGGLVGWDKKIWNTAIQDDAVWMTLLSPDREEGYPGAVIATIKFSITDDGKLIIKMSAVSTKATPINLTNHSYFNLFGHDGNATELYKHEITINANRWTVTDADSIPTGEIRPVANSIMDLRVAKQLGQVLPKVPSGGYDFNFCIPEDHGPKGERFVARVLHPDSGRYLEVHSNQPGVQLYTSNFLPDITTQGILGKDQQKYFKHGALCLETQNYPDAVNHANFPNSILRPGQTYEHIVIYKFGVQNQ
ncbi:uncharacterized protein LOC105691574 isoform X3 [Athalia rosae]|uniref:uncharacterized protein LOC105691574 isoform X3 n=1 Tax=Athalia rosae TaxID=37344 RepID=UPI002033D595|nr:uncharacterized protein LOC105691574 isoform X3 [Athalia rosae]XP_048506375.1 uncharacterized protein LOC105691574 isoform X3 [Athalia rosae]XP_048506409.1 uncharacterized protein LOC105691574 isoform X3 [Athalia rosae]XP_048506440.1 uncharacterized protein LOC105691574 isoform X3 [Athalia rosae]XP_048506477.1 uncharacterized protein LOC105691574 isoform X3 [Athalia rosae]XP_048506540.1 uncharacterized protein LOC105691574 isoform X3 [Athalia rosae]XP_048506575.1 uncharacterized protein LO